MQIRLLLSFVLSTSLVLTSCTKSKLPTPPPDTPEIAQARTAIELVNKDVISGTWNVATCIYDGNDITAKFANYDLVFTNNGTVKAIADNVTITGKWVTAYIDDKVRMSLDFQNMPTVTPLAGDWYITASSGQNMRMAETGGVGNVLSIARK